MALIARQKSLAFISRIWQIYFRTICISESKQSISDFRHGWGHLGRQDPGKSSLGSGFKIKKKRYFGKSASRSTNSKKRANNSKQLANLYGFTPLQSLQQTASWRKESKPCGILTVLNFTWAQVSTSATVSSQSISMEGGQRWELRWAKDFFWCNT